MFVVFFSLICCLFFFSSRRRHTRLVSDWSSDVCSSDLTGRAGRGWLTSLVLLDLSTQDFIKGLKLFYVFKDVWFGLLKSASFGFTITLVGCIVGLSTRGGAEGVGRSTTRTVVYSAILILVLDAFWAVVLL